MKNNKLFRNDKGDRMLQTVIKVATVSVVAVVMIIMLTVDSYAAKKPGISGSYAIKIADYNDDFGHSQLLIQYLDVEAAISKNLSLIGFGSLQTAILNENSTGDLYLAYLHYLAFEDSSELMLGRFDLVTNRFMTVDGVSLSHKTDYKVGVSGYVGEPKFREIRRGDDNFRSTGDILYGGSIFLAGVPNATFNVNYSNESGKDDNRSWTTFRETAGVGGSYYFPFDSDNKSSVTVAGLYDHDIQNNVAARAMARVTALSKESSKVSLFVDYFDVRDQYPAGRELIIRLLSTGLETRYGGSLTVYPVKDVDVYFGYTRAEITMRGDIDNTGQIYNFGTSYNMLKTRGIILSADGYVYASEFGTATGVAGSVDWYITSYLNLDVTAEQAWLKDTRDDGDVFSVEGELTLDATDSIALQLFGQAGTNRRFADTSRVGVMVKYVF